MNHSSGFRAFCRRHSTLFRVAGLLGPGLSLTAYLSLQQFPSLTSFRISPAMLAGWFVAGVVCCMLGTVYREERPERESATFDCLAWIVMSILVAAPITGTFFLVTNWLNPPEEHRPWEGGFRPLPEWAQQQQQRPLNDGDTLSGNQD